MQLTDELFEKYKDGHEKYVDLGNGNILLFKSMPVEDQRLGWYIAAINKAKEAGIKIAGISDYKLITGATNSYSNGGITYSKGVFIEDKVEGVCLPYKVFSTKEVFYVDDFLSFEEAFVSELERRASASTEVYDKLVSDYKKLNDYGIIPDPKPTSFFFSEKIGYTITDVITKTRKNEEPYMPGHIFNVVFGSGIPYINDSHYKKNDILTFELKERYEKAYDILTAKIISALRKNDIKEEYIDKELVRREKARKSGIKEMEKEQIEEYISSLMKSKKI